MSGFVGKVRWRMGKGPKVGRRTRWHLTSDSMITWCGLRIKWGHRRSESNLWRGERDGTCKSCLFQLDSHGAKKGLHRKKGRGWRTGINR